MRRQGFGVSTMEPRQCESERQVCEPCSSLLSPISRLESDFARPGSSALNEAGGGNGLLLTPTVALLSYWFVSLRVLTEGWSELQLGDPVIDDLLSSPHLALLQRYRNGVCHYQSDFASSKFADLAADSDAIAWVKRLDQVSALTSSIITLNRMFVSSRTGLGTELWKDPSLQSCPIEGGSDDAE